MIRSIELRNWKTHQDTKLEFKKGTNILIGQMGTGKSSIMDAISFSLFGIFPAIQHKRVNVSKLIRNKPSQEKNAYVRINLELGGDEYGITRELSIDGKSSATIERNGAYLQSQPQRVTEEVERILKVDYDMFSKVVYSEQNGLDYFLNLRSSDRKKQIDGLLGLDKFATAQDNATTLVNRIRDMVVDSERIVKEFDVSKANEELDALKTELESLNKEHAASEVIIKANGTEKSKLEVELNKLKEQNSRKTALSKEMEGIKSRIGLLESEIKEIDINGYPKKEDASTEKRSLQSKIENLKALDKQNTENERKIHSEIAKLEVELSNAKKDLSEKERINKELSKNGREHTEKELKELNHVIEQLSTDLAHSRSVIADTEKQMRELIGHISKCPVCERELTDDLVSKIHSSKEKLIEEHKSKSRKIDEDLTGRKARLKDLNALLNAVTVMEDKLKSYSGIEERSRIFESNLSSSKLEYEKAKAAKDATSKEILSVTESIQKINSIIESIARRERHASEIEKLSSSLSEKTREHDSIKVDEKSIDRIQSDLVKVNSEISKQTANLNSTVKYLKDKEAQIKKKESDIEKINKLYADLSKKRLLVDNLSKFKISLAETQAVMRTQLITSINEIMGEIWSQLYPYGDYTGVILDVSDDDYSLKLNTLVDNKYVWEDVESIASGGEKSTACLAMRIAFSLVLVPNLKWLILDEPTHNIDREGLGKFVQMFGETLPNIIDQIFIITHDEVLKQVNNANIYQLSRNKAENRETVAVAL